MQNIQIILASGSPRRQELLSKMGVKFVAIASDYTESLDENRPPARVAIDLAIGKAKKIAEKYPESLVLGADTLVWTNDRQLGKPANKQEAMDMLKLLANQQSHVTTAIALISLSRNIKIAKTDTTSVYFKPYNEVATRAYVATGDALDKSGGYGIQSGAAPLIDCISGSYDTVIGLPTEILAQALNSLGIEAKPVFLKPSVPQK